MDNNQKYQLLQQMGVDVYHLRADEVDPVSEPIVDESLQVPVQSDDTLSSLVGQVAACKQCDLHQSRTQTVFGTGNPDARIMFVGEAPGRDEDLQGQPFVGRAGQLLNLMFASLSWDRDDVYIANILKCRPPGNRNPQPAEITECEPYLIQQIELIKPQLLVALGRIAAQNLLASSESIARLRGQKHRYEKGNIPVIVTYHPAYLLRNPIDKAKVWQDLLFIKSQLT